MSLCLDSSRVLSIWKIVYRVWILLRILVVLQPWGAHANGAKVGFSLDMWESLPSHFLSENCLRARHVSKECLMKMSSTWWSEDGHLPFFSHSRESGNRRLGGVSCTFDSFWGIAGLMSIFTSKLENGRCVRAHIRLSEAVIIVASSVFLVPHNFVWCNFHSKFGAFVFGARHRELEVSGRLA